MRHCDRKRIGIDVRLYDSTGRLPADWQKLIPVEHFLRKEQLDIYEHTRLPDVDFIYALVYDNDKPAAAAYFQVLQIREEHLDTARQPSWKAASWRLFTKTMAPKLLIAGHLFRHDITSFFFPEAISSFEAFKCYQAAINRALQQSGAMAVLVKDLPEPLTSYFQHYAPEYMLMRNDISMEMEIPEDWQIMRDYEKALKHKYAQRYRKVRQGWDQLEVKELSVDEVYQNKDLLFQLYKEVNDHQQVRLGLLSEDYLPELKKSNPHTLRIWLAFEEQKPVAFFSAWVLDEVFDMFYIGFDYNRNEALQLYFNILFFSIEQAVLSGKPRLILGRTALEAKARLGCKPRYLSTFIYIRNRFLRNFIARMQEGFISGEGEWENRHPFKPV